MNEAEQERERIRCVRVAPAVARVTKMGTARIAFFVLSFAWACNVDTEVPEILVVAAESTVSVMSFNIFHNDHNDEKNIPGWKERKPLVIDAIRLMKPDIVGLQEAFMSQVDELVKAMPEYAFVGRGREANGSDSDESVSLLYRKAIFDKLGSGHFWFSDTPDIPGSRGGESWGDMHLPRMTTWIRLRKKGTTHGFYVFNTHLASSMTADNADQSRRRSVVLLAEKIANRAHPTEHFVVTGDFNTEHEKLPIMFLTGQASSCWSASPCPVPPPMTPVKMTDVNAGGGGTKCSNNPGDSAGSRIDYIFVWSPDSQGFCDSSTGACTPPQTWDAQTVPPLPSCASDHRPVFAKVLMPLIIIDN